MPVRTCVACRRKREKSRLLRWVVAEDGRAVPDPRAVLRGRGSYVCRDAACLETLRRRSARIGADFEPEAEAFRLAIQGDVLQNVPGEAHDN